MRDRVLWRWLRSLGRLGGGPELPGLLQALDPASAPAIADAMAAHGVAEIAQRNLRAAAHLEVPGRTLAALIDALVARQTRYRVEVEPTMREVLERTARLHGHCVHGLAMQRFYAEPGLRHMGDIDVHFSELGGALDLTAALRHDGWAWDPDSLPWLSWNDDGHVYGKLPLLLRRGGRVLTYADLRFGPYYIGYAGAMVPEFEDGRVWDISIQGPTSECIIAMLAGNASDDFRLTMKDVNDIGQAALSRPVDWERVVSFVEPVCLEPVLEQMVAAAEAAYGPLGSPFAGQPYDRPLPLSERGRVGGALHRARITLRHERHRGSLWRAMARSSTAFAYHVLSGSPRRTWRWRRRSAPDRGYRWRLVPEELWSALADGRVCRADGQEVEDLSGELRLVQWRDASVVLWRDEVFVPTVWGGLPRRSLDLARAVRAGAGR